MQQAAYFLMILTEVTPIAT